MDTAGRPPYCPSWGRLARIRGLCLGEAVFVSRPGAVPARAGWVAGNAVSEHIQLVEITFWVNGEERLLSIDTRSPLLDVLRE